MQLRFLAVFASGRVGSRLEPSRVRGQHPLRRFERADAPSTRLTRDFGARRVAGTDVVVIGTVDQNSLEQIATTAHRAVANVDRVWGRRWPKPVVVVAPRDPTETAKLLDRTPAQIVDTAGWTIGPRATGQPAARDEVVLNPQQWDQANDRGRVATLTHEFTHVAVRGTTTRDGPLWFVEGFAQYVAYRDIGLSAQVLAREYLDRLGGEPPSRLPPDAAFAAPGTIRDDAYTASWLAVREIAERQGEAALLTAVRQGDVTAAGWTQAQLTARWRAAVRELSGTTSTGGAAESTAPQSHR